MSESGRAPHNQSTPNVVPSRDATGTPGRARTLPHDLLAKIAKRNSMPDPPTHEMTSQPMPNTHMTNRNSPLSTSPLSQFNDFTPQLGQTQIPDLKNVMFPSDNPFAYPNQPMSILENSGFGYPDPTSASLESPFAGTPNDASMMGTPVSGMTSNPDQSRGGPYGPPQPQYDMTSLQRLYEENPQLAAHLAQRQQQQRHYPQVSTPMSGGGFPHDAGQQSQQPQHNMFDMPQQSPVVGSQPEDYWSQMNKSNVPPRPGFMPGAAVNLDELFGGGDGWGGSGMWDAQGFPRQ